MNMGPLSEMGLITILGMSIVFSVLIILWGTTSLLHVAVKYFEKKKKDTAVIEEAPVVADEPENTADDEELIAVLTAAVAASLNTTTYNLRIKSFRRVGNTAPAWSAISRKEQLENNL